MLLKISLAVFLCSASLKFLIFFWALEARRRNIFLLNCKNNNLEKRHGKKIKRSANTVHWMRKKLYRTIHIIIHILNNMKNNITNQEYIKGKGVRKYFPWINGVTEMSENTRKVTPAYFRFRCCLPGQGGSILTTVATAFKHWAELELVTVVCSDIITLQYEDALIWPLPVYMGRHRSVKILLSLPNAPLSSSTSAELLMYR